MPEESGARRSSRKQLIVLAILGGIFSFIFFYQLQWSGPRDAAITAFWYCAPAIVFAAIAIWWFRPAK